MRLDSTFINYLLLSSKMEFYKTSFEESHGPENQICNNNKEGDRECFKWHFLMSFWFENENYLNPNQIYGQQWSIV